MYGMILVETEGGMLKVDHEFHVMQGEIYTEKAFGSSGLLDEPGKYMLVDHALSRVAHGLAGTLVVSGPQNVVLFEDYDLQRSAMVLGHRARTEPLWSRSR
jgi:hypothetical protein